MFCLTDNRVQNRPWGKLWGKMRSERGRQRSLRWASVPAPGTGLNGLTQDPARQSRRLRTPLLGLRRLLGSGKPEHCDQIEMSKKKRKRAKRAERPAEDRPERGKDPRLVALPASEMDGEELPTGTWVQVLSPVLMDDGRELLWYPPQPVAFNLVEAKQARDRGAKPVATSWRS